MNLYLTILLVVLNQAAYRGNRVLISLFALELGAGPFVIGTLASITSLFSLFFAIYAGRISDRLGSGLPMLLGSFGILCAFLLPYFVPHLTALYFSSIIAGTFYIFFQIAAQHVVGAQGTGHRRTSNFGLYSLSVSATLFLGPVAAGFAIDSVGHQSSYLLLALAPMCSVLTLIAFFPKSERGVNKSAATGHQAVNLFKNLPLRRALIATAAGEMGNEMYAFFMPIYGHSLHLSASAIGLIMGAYAAATLVARLIMPVLARRSSEEMVLCGSLVLSTMTCALLPFAASMYALAGISFLLGLGLGCYGPLSMIIVYNRAPTGRGGEALGLRTSVTKSTEVVVPLISGAISSWWGLGPVFWLVAPMLAIGAFIMHNDARKTGRHSSRHQ